MSWKGLGFQIVCQPGWPYSNLFIHQARLSSLVTKQVGLTDGYVVDIYVKARQPFHFIDGDNDHGRDNDGDAKNMVEVTIAVTVMVTMIVKVMVEVLVALLCHAYIIG